jgi:hypothetical protein
MTSELDGGEWSSSRPGRALPPGERTPGTHCTGGWVGPRAGLDTEDTGKILCPCRESNPDRPVVQPVVRHYTAWATPVPRKILYKIKIQHFKKYNFFKNQNSTVRLPVKWEVCVLRTCFSVCIYLKERSVYKIQSSDYPHFSIIRASPPYSLARIIESTL